MDDAPLCTATTRRWLALAALVFASVSSAAAQPAGTAAPRDAALLRALLSTAPPTGKNTVIVGHADPIYTLIGGQYLEEGAAAVVRPDGAGFQVVARVGLKEWREMAER